MYNTIQFAGSDVLEVADLVTQPAVGAARAALRGVVGVLVGLCVRAARDVGAVDAVGEVEVALRHVAGLVAVAVADPAVRAPRRALRDLAP